MDEDDLDESNAFGALASGMMNSLLQPEVLQGLTNTAQAMGQGLAEGMAQPQRRTRSQANGNDIPNFGDMGFPMTQANGNDISDFPTLKPMRQANGNNVVPNFEDLMNELGPDSDEELEETDDDDGEEDALGNTSKVVQNIDSVPGKKKLSRTGLLTLQYFHNVCGCDPMNWKTISEENGQNFHTYHLEGINFGDYGFVTDATILGWLGAADITFNGNAEKLTLNLSGNRYLTDFGLILASNLFKAHGDLKTPSVTIELDGCEKVTEAGLAVLIKSLETAANVDIVATRTSVSHVPVSHGRVKITSTLSPVITQDVGKKTNFLPSSRVFVCPQRELKRSVGSCLATGEQNKEPNGVSRFEISVQNNHKVNIIETTLDHPSTQALLTGNLDFIIIPFSMENKKSAYSHINSCIARYLHSPVPFSSPKTMLKVILVGLQGDTISDWGTDVYDELLSTFQEYEVLKNYDDAEWNHGKRLPSFTDHITMSLHIATMLNNNKFVENFGGLVEMLQYHKDINKNDLIVLISRAIETKIALSSAEFCFKEPKIFEKLCGMKEEKIVSREQILKAIQRDFQQTQSAHVIDQHLGRLHDWGRVLFLKEADPPVVITDPGWFVDVLNKLSNNPPHLAKDFLPCLHGSTPLWKGHDLVRLAMKGLSEEKLQLLLHSLLSYSQLLLIQPEHHATQDTKYFLLPMQLLVGPVDPEIWEQYVGSDDKEDNMEKVSRHFNLKVAYPEKVDVTVWYSVLGEVTRFCKPSMLHQGGIAWHQGAVETVLYADVNDGKFTEIVLRAKSVALPGSEHNVLTHLYHLFSIYEDIIMYCLYKSGALLELSSEMSPKGQRSTIRDCDSHTWEQPLPTIEKGKVVGSAQNQVATICSLCSNCSGKGVSCEFNGIKGDNYLQCLCNTEQICCYCCGICKRCAKLLWTYRSFLRPNLNPAQSFTTTDLEGQMQQPHRSDVIMDPVLFNKVDASLMFKSKTQSMTLEGDHHVIKFLDKKMVENLDEATRFTLSLSDDSESTSDRTLPMVNFSTCKDVEAWPNGRVKFSMEQLSDGTKEDMAQHDSTRVPDGQIISKHPMTPENFYFEIEIVKRSETGVLRVGFTKPDSSPLAMIQFSSNGTSNEKLVHQTKVRKDEAMAIYPTNYIGCGVSFEKGTIAYFFAHGNRDQKLKVTEFLDPDQDVGVPKVGKDVQMHAGVFFDGPGDWEIRVIPSAAWNNEETVISSIKDSVAAAPEPLPHARSTMIGTSPIQCRPTKQLVFHETGQSEYFASVELRYLPNFGKGKPYLFKAKVTNPRGYTVRPNSGVLKENEGVNVLIKGVDVSTIAKDKFRIDVIEDVQEKSVKDLGTEYSPYTDLLIKPGQFTPAKVSAAWDSYMKINVPVQTTVLKGRLEKEKVFTPTSFVESKFSVFNSGRKSIGQLMKVKDSDTEQNPCKLEWISQDLADGTSIHRPQPNQKTLIMTLEMEGMSVFSAPIPYDNYRLVIDGFDRPPHAPPLQSLNQMSIMREKYGRHVAADFMEDQFRRVMFAPRMPRRRVGFHFEKGQTVYIPWTNDQDKFCEENKCQSLKTKILYEKAVTKRREQVLGDTSEKKAEKRPKKVGFNLEDTGKEEAPELLDKLKAFGVEAEQEDVVLYIPAQVKKVLSSRLEVEWKVARKNKGSGTNEAIETQAMLFERSVVRHEDVHSVYWAYEMDNFSDYIDVSEDPTFKLWRKIFNFDTYEWDNTHKSKNMEIKGSLAKRGFVSQSTDMVRGSIGFKRGNHTFKIVCESDGGWGSFGQVGVCNKDSVPHLSSYCILLGSDKNSWGWNIPTSGLMHAGSRSGLTPKKNETTVFMEMCLDSNEPYLRYFFADDKEGFTAFKGHLNVKSELFPAVACVFGGTELRITYVKGTDTSGSIGSEIYVHKFNDEHEKASGHCYLPTPCSADGLDALSNDLSYAQKTLLGVFALTGDYQGCDADENCCTVLQRRLQINGINTELSRNDANIPFVALPRQLQESLVLYPQLSKLINAQELNIHPVCHVRDVWNRIVGQELLDLDPNLSRQIMHILDDRGYECHANVDFKSSLQACMSSYITLATHKVILPSTVEALFGKSHWRKEHQENGLQTVFMTYSAIAALNILNSLDESATTSDFLVEAIGQTSKTELKEKHICDGHRWALNIEKPSQETAIREKAAEEEILDLKRAEKYGDCITNISLDLKEHYKKLKEIPENFQDVFSNLRTFHIYGRQMKYYLENPLNLGSLKKLEALIIENTGLKNLSDDLGSCSKLKYLISRDNDRLESLPSSIGKAPALEHVIVDNSILSTVPKDVGDLRNLSHLSLNRNKLKTLPLDFSALHKLTVLHIIGICFSPHLNNRVR